jgi:hypothetical protein
MKNESDLQSLLPERLRSSFIILPRNCGWRLPLIGILIGAGGALTMTGFLHGPGVLSYSFPLALVLLWLLRLATERLDLELLKRALDERDRSA